VTIADVRLASAPCCSHSNPSFSPSPVVFPTQPFLRTVRVLRGLALLLYDQGSRKMNNAQKSKRSHDLCVRLPGRFTRMVAVWSIWNRLPCVAPDTICFPRSFHQ